jgi:hypothetical protein
VGDVTRFSRTPEQEFYDEALRAGSPAPSSIGVGRTRRRAAESEENRAAVDAALKDHKARKESGRINEADAGSQEPGFFGLGGLKNVR